MLKRFLLAVATVALCSSSMFAQDFFLSFADDALVTESEILEAGETTSAFIFSRDGFDYIGAQFGFEIADTGVGTFTGGEFFLNSPGIVPLPRFLSGTTTVDAGGGSGITGAANTTNGIGPGSPLATLDLPIADVGHLVGRLDLTATGGGDALVTILERGPNGILARDFSDITDSTTIGGGGITLRVNAIPEPTSAGLLAMGLIGLVARRRR